MDEIIMRRLRHLQRLEENHAQEFEARYARTPNCKKENQEALANIISADWNSRQKAKSMSASYLPLPQGWRKEHWKTQQAMASDYAGVIAKNKEEAVRALEIYEAELTLPPAV